MRSESSTLCQLCAGIHPAIPRLSQEDSADVGGPGVDYIVPDGGSGCVAVGILKR